VALARGANVDLVAASGEHLGAAIAAAEHLFEGSVAFAVGPATEADIPLGESVGRQAAVALGADVARPAAPVGGWRWPKGVVPALDATRDGQIGWTVVAQPELLVIEAATDASHLTDLFMGMLERLPAGDNLEVRVKDHFDHGAADEIWITSRVNAKKILRFLDDYDRELIENGHVELSIYVRAHKATLRLTEHKTVVWLAEERALEADVTRWLGELGVPHAPGPLATVRDGAHFHYRVAKTRDRKKLSDTLYRERLRRVRDTAG
jgi:hypothetical protein